MDGQELYNLYEAYLEVIENQQLDEEYKNLPRLKMAKKMASKAASAFGGAHKAGREGDSPETTGGQIAVSKGQKKINQAFKMHDVATKHSAEKSKSREKSNKSPSGNVISVLDAAKRFGSSSKKPQKKDSYMDVIKRGIIDGINDGIGEHYDYYDIILSHLLDEGYAETLESAEAMMVNMSEEWRYSILEKKRQYDDGHGFDRSKHDDLEIDYDRPRGKNQDQSIRGYTSIRHKPSGITYEINHDKKHGNYNMPSDLKGKARKAHGHKPEHNVRWSHDRELKMFRGDEMSRGDRIKTARNAKRVWDKHIQHRIPSGHLVSNEPDDNPDDNRRNPEKNTRASIYQRSGFGKTNRMGKQYSTKIGKKLHPVNDDED